MKLDDLVQSVKELPPYTGITSADLLMFPDPLSSVLAAMLRSEGLTRSELAEALGLTCDEIVHLGELLIQKGIFGELEQQAHGDVCYKIRLARSHKARKRSSTDLWKALDSS
jgi:hypothetical protein